MIYPTPPRSNDVDVLAGVSFEDPFRPLEADDEAGVLEWQRAQADLADAYVAALPGVDELRALVARHPNGALGGVNQMIPRFAGGKWFRKTPAERPSGEAVVVSDEPFGAGRTVLTALQNRDAQGRIPFLSWLSPSPDGRFLAVGVCHDGSEGNTIRLIDVESGCELDDRPAPELMDNWMGGAQWLPDSAAFYYVALVGAKQDCVQGIYRHDIGDGPDDVPEPVPLASDEAEARLGVFVSRCGRYVAVSQGLMRTRPVALLDLDSERSWRPFVVDIDNSVAGHVIGSEYVAVTDQGAPRGRVVGIPIDSDAAGEPSQWREIVPESEAVLRTVVPIDGRLYLSELVDTYARVRIVDLQGAERGTVPLPDRGAISELPFRANNLVPPAHPNEYVFFFSTLTESWGCYRHRPGDDEIETLQAPQVKLDAVVEDLCATSGDGTRVPYHVVRRPDASADDPEPTLIWAYGGFNVPLVPEFPGSMAAFIECGGVFVHAHLRGGGELGHDWWQNGRREHKQNCYEDLFAVAEDLITRGRTTPDLLAVTGESNGGLMSGVAATQRPELWRAVIPRVARLDLIGSYREPYGRLSVVEYGDPDTPEGVALLASISPYELVEDGIVYPAVFVDTGATDTRCSPRNGRKFVARLQEANVGPHPILLRVWEDVGHGAATTRDREVAQHTAWLAFVMDQLEMTTADRGST